MNSAFFFFFFFQSSVRYMWKCRLMQSTSDDFINQSRWSLERYITYFRVRFMSKRLNLYHYMGMFSRRQFKMVFYFFPKKQALIFHANCLKGDNLHERSKPIFWEKIENHFKLSSAVFFPAFLALKCKFPSINNLVTYFQSYFALG